MPESRRRLAVCVAIGLVAIACSDSKGGTSSHARCGDENGCNDAGSNGTDAIASNAAGAAGVHDFGEDAHPGGGHPGVSQNAAGADDGRAGAPDPTSGAGGAGGDGSDGGKPPQDDPCHVELLQNRNFDGSGGWTESATPSGYELTVPARDASKLLGVTVDAPTSPNLLWLGGVAGDTQSAYQSIAVPQNALTLELHGKVLVGTEQSSTSNGDRAGVGFVDAFGSSTELASFKPTDADPDWKTFDASISAADFAGQSWSFGAACITDGYANTNFFFDELSLRAVVCE